MAGTGTKHGERVHTSVVLDENTNRLLQELAAARYDGNRSMTLRMAVRALANQTTVAAVQQSGGAS